MSINTPTFNLEESINKIFIKSPFIKDIYSIAGYIFDVTMSVSHNLVTQITEHPVQYGSVISDHTLNRPAIINFQIGVSDCATTIFRDDFSASGSKQNILRLFQADPRYIDNYSLAKIKQMAKMTPQRSNNALNVLDGLRLAAIPFDVTTRLKTYNNILIENISFVEDSNTGKALIATVSMKEVPMAQVQKVQIKSTYQAVQQTNSGEKKAGQAPPVLRSMDREAEIRGELPPI